MGGGESMYKTIKTRLYLSSDENTFLRLLSKTANNLYNVGLYNVRQHFFKTGKYLSYNANDLLC